MKKAVKRVEKYLSTQDKNNFKKLQDFIRITEKIEAFGTDKVLGVY